ncbi:monooxygenase [Saccharospirillum sp. MSK14-1]|uniref:NtaA/DmoA family FMN-dependent monooxygenase n=1 Tax=Saccharospirillum sp. MSK14-1 TaxID=1897632 RepID=UPI000D3926CD|nr:NtaA/DmoA family FMN-dependent monooxygenase [Saccharospirillum sp. MSK14-1]PTY38678.1 monooxygenase [Saccharospirillum sp. MSK14-1]
MTTTRHLHVGLSLAATWLSGSAWRRADSQVEGLFGSDFYIDVARRAEAAKLDFLFRPDTLFLDPAMTATGPGFSSLDPSILIASLARETQRIGLVTTASTTFYPPYVVARQLQSLNWLSGGRIGWNVVTSLDGQRNFGLNDMPPAEQRYAQAEEFTAVVRQLWNSYPAEALRFDRASGQFADRQRIQPINHHGDYCQVEGPLNTPAAGASIPLFQAGASDIGRQFAARIADATFAATPDIDAGIELRNDLRARALAQGRSADSVRVMPGFSCYLADTRDQARELFQATHADTERARLLAKAEGLLDMELSGLADDQPITLAMLPTPPHRVRSRTHTELVYRLIERESPTLDELIRRPEVMGSAHWLVVGTPDDAVTEIVERFEAGAADGIIALPGGSNESLNRFLDQVVPALVERGLFRSDYSGSTLADHLGMN